MNKRTFKIGFSKPKNRIFPIFSYFIKWFLKTEYSHVFVQFDSESLGTSLIYESVGEGVRFISFDLWKEKAEITDIFEIEVDTDIYKEIMRFCINNSGKEYGFSQNIGVFLAYLTKLSHNPFNKNQNCSETTAKIINIIKKIFNSDINLVTPRDIYEVLSENKVPGQKASRHLR